MEGETELSINEDDVSPRIFCFLRVTPSIGIRVSDMSVADEGASPDELLREPLLFRVYQRSP